MKAVEEPMMAVIHIQNTAPAPPAETAATTPTRLPMPTLVAVETMRAWKEERLFLLFFFSVRAFSISGKSRMGRKWVRMVKKIPVGIRSRIRSEMPRLLPPGSGIRMKSPQRNW